MTKKIETPEVSELKAKYAALTAEKSALKAKREKVIEKHEQNEKNISSLVSRVKDFEKEIRQAEKKELRGEISAADLDKINSEYNAAVKAMNEADKLRHLASDVVRELDIEIANINRGISIARDRVCKAIQADLVSQLDHKEISDKLLEIFACRNLSGDENWPRMLTDIFQQPRKDDVELAIAEFRKINFPK